MGRCRLGRILGDLETDDPSWLVIKGDHGISQRSYILPNCAQDTASPLAAPTGNEPKYLSRVNNHPTVGRYPDESHTSPIWRAYEPAL
jgi:hypothetical protein